MLRATQSSEIPDGAQMRARAEDTDRTKMLKEVMKSVAKYASSGLGKGENDSAKAAGQLMMKAAADDEEAIRRAVMQKEWDPCDQGFLSAEQEKSILASVLGDADVTELDVAKEFSELLRHTSSLVSSHSSSLSSSGPLPERPRRIDPSSVDVCLIPRIEAEDIVAGGSDDHKRTEQAAMAWVNENVKFKEVEKLSQQIDDTNKFEDLRAHFEQHHKYHPVLHLLSDHSLVDHSMWKTAVREAMYPSVSEAEAIPKLQPSYYAPKALSKTKSSKAVANSSGRSGSKTAGKTNRISWAGPGTLERSSGSPGSPERGLGVGKLSKDRSAPALH